MYPSGLSPRLTEYLRWFRPTFHWLQIERSVSAAGPKHESAEDTGGYQRAGQPPPAMRDSR